MHVIDIAEKLGTFDEHWAPHIIAELNGQHVKIAKLLGEFDWHFHENEDELFWVIQGKLIIHFRDSTVELQAGQMCVVPKGVEHKPIAEEETHILLFEPMSTKHTGDVKADITVESYEEI